MCFLGKPPNAHTPNSEMDEMLKAIAEDFLNKLVNLGVLVEDTEGQMEANGPLFCLPKQG